MSADVVEMVSANRSRLEMQIVLQCAPVLTGVKMSNILIVDAVYKKQVLRILQSTGIAFYRMYELNGKLAFLVFHWKALESYLNQPSIKRFLKSLGYDRVELGQILCRISKQYKAFMITKEDFPHELGIVLGYPLSDVIGFMKYKGKNYRYSGYWKVYGDVEAAKRQFEEFEFAKEQLVRMIARGIELSDILDIYSTNRQNQIAI